MKSERLPFLVMLFAVLLQTGCGGGGGSPGVTEAGTPGAGTPPATDPAASAPDLSQPALQLPANIADGGTVELQCGRVYQGTLDLRGKSNVTVRTSGSCGRAVITPSEVVSGWTLYRGNIYSAPVSFHPVQVIVAGQPVEQAHWPDRSRIWARADSSTADTLRYTMPSSDLVGATLIFKPYEWAVEARRITAYSNGVMSLTSTGNPNYDGYGLGGQVQFYVEGKLWMLDEPGEWAFSEGRLYVWSPDGESPEGRIWVTPDRHGVDAAASRNITLDGINVFGAVNGIHAVDAVNLKVLNADISASAGNGLMNSGGRGLTVDRIAIRNARHDGIIVKWGGGAESIRNSRIERAGAVGMPVNTHASIATTLAEGSVISGNVIVNSGYIGIRAFRDAVVSNNIIEGACIVLSDCGGIYVSAHDRQPLNTRIENNTVSKVGLEFRLSWGIYLDEGANAVIVANNDISAGYNGLLIHNGFNNSVTANNFSRHRQSHVQMAESAASSVRNNTVTGNTMSSRDGEETYRISSDFGTSAVSQFASYGNNIYASSSATFANYNGEPVSFNTWRSRTGDNTSSLVAP